MHALGLKIIVTTAALKETNERMFPVSKNRSRRIHKKLVKRHGGEFRKVGAIWKTPDALYVHPSLYEELKRQIT